MRSKMGRANQKNTKPATTTAARTEKIQPLPTTVRMRQTAVQMASATMAKPISASTLASLSNWSSRGGGRPSGGRPPG